MPSKKLKISKYQTTESDAVFFDTDYGFGALGFINLRFD